MRTISRCQGSRRGLLDEIEDVFLGFGGKVQFLALRLGLVFGGQGAPQVVDLGLQVRLTLPLACIFLGHGQLGRPLVAIHAVVHQGMAGVQDLFDRLLAVALLAFGHVVAGEHQVIQDALGIGPGAEQVVALEEGVVTVGGMGDHQRLHGHGVLLHQIGDAGVGVDDDLVGQAHVAALIALLCSHELLAEGPVVVAHICSELITSIWLG